MHYPIGIYNIEGDNLEAMKLLRQNYYGAVKMIYINPPYNTGNDFVYNDNFAMSGKESDIAEGTRDEEGIPLQKNQQSSNRYHANWLNMMYPRVRVAKDLLTDDGVIFISIDDNEVENLKKICTEILGESNYLAEFPRVTKKGGKSSDVTAKNHDYVLLYAKNATQSDLIGVSHNDSGYNNQDEFFEQRGFYKINQTLDYDSLGYSQSLDYPITLNGEIFYPGGRKDLFDERQSGKHARADWAWRWSKGLFDFGYKNGFIEIRRGGARPRIYTKTYQKVKIEEVGGQYKIVEIDRTKPLSTLEFTENKYSNDNAKKAVDTLMGSNVFEYTKPPELLEKLTCLVNGSNFTVLDFFSGSATTAHAIIQLNSEDSGNRKFVMVQLPEEIRENSEADKSNYKNICEIGKERIRRAGEKIKQEIETANAQLKLGEEPKQVPDIGFKVFRTGDTNIKWNLYDALGQLDTSAMTHTPDLADFTMGFNDIDVVYEVMLRQKDVPLSSTLETLTDIGSRTYLYGSAYLVCLEIEITEVLIDKLAALDPLPIKFVFRDSAFKDDINLKDETFRRLKNLIERNSGLAKKSYTVEFI